MHLLLITAQDISQTFQNSSYLINHSVGLVEEDAVNSLYILAVMWRYGQNVYVVFHPSLVEGKTVHMTFMPIDCEKMWLVQQFMILQISDKSLSELFELRLFDVATCFCSYSIRNISFFIHVSCTRWPLCICCYRLLRN